jgi:hypothetical protein
MPWEPSKIKDFDKQFIKTIRGIRILLTGMDVK